MIDLSACTLLWGLAAVSVMAGVRLQNPLSNEPVRANREGKAKRPESREPQIFASQLQIAKAKASRNTSQWRAFKARLDKQLGQVIQGGYQGSGLSWISDYSLGYQCLKDTDPATASKYADKAIAIMKSGMRDHQRGYWTTLQFLAITDGVTVSYRLPNEDIIPETFKLYATPIKTVSVIRGKKPNTADPVENFVEFIRVGNSATGSDYLKGVDWQRNGDLPNNMLDWSLPGKEPDAGAKYFVSFASRYEAQSHKLTNFTLHGGLVTFVSALPEGQALFVEYVYGTPSKDGSTLAYQQTSARDGGFNSIFVDANYTSRFLGKHIAMGLDWLDGYSGLTPALKGEAMGLLVRWNDYLRDHGYANEPSRNYGAGSYCSRAMTALALKERDAVNGPRILSEILTFRQRNVQPLLGGASRSFQGGYWEEGYNYGVLAAQNLLLAGAALEGAGEIQASAEHVWAGEMIRYLITSQPTPTTTFNGGDWYAYPAPFPGAGPPGSDKTIFYVAAVMTKDPGAKAYANRIIQMYAGAQSENYLDLLFRNPDAAASGWNSEPLQYFASGTNLLVARSDWSANPVFVSVSFNPWGHATLPPGQVQIQHGADDLLVNSSGVIQTQSGQLKSTYGNCIVVDDNGDKLQTYRWAMGFWYGKPGIVVKDCQTQPDYVYISGDFKAAYSHNGEPGRGGPVAELNRQVVYLRPNWIVVYDRVRTVKESYPKQQRWHCLEAPTVSGNKFVVRRGQSKLFGEAYSSQPLSVSSSQVSVAKAALQQIIVQNRDAASSTRYLTVMEVAPQSQMNMSAVQFSSSNDGKWDEVQIGNAKLTFAKGGGEPGFQFSSQTP